LKLQRGMVGGIAPERKMLPSAQIEERDVLKRGAVAQRGRECGARKVPPGGVPL